jgi:FkbM family methyltransferase
MDKTPKRSLLAEFVVRQLNAVSGKSLVARVRRWSFTRLRRILVSRTDLYSRISLGGTELLVPLDHDLPLIRSLHPQYAANIGRLCGYIAESDPRMSIVDIGANIGDTVAIIREHCQSPILCIEPNPRYFRLLQANLQRAGLQGVQMAKAFVATYTGEIKGQLVSGAGSGHFTNTGDAMLQARRLGDLLQDFSQFIRPRLLKIDTDGFDCSILRSELEWLGSAHPIIFFEYDPFFFMPHPYDGSQIFRDLSSAGYTFAIFYDNFGDYLISVDLTRDRIILEDLQQYFVGRGGHQYLDVAVFPGDDYELALKIRTHEAALSRMNRLKASHTIN